MAEDACSQMQVCLAIAPNHREDVMAYIAPKSETEIWCRFRRGSGGICVMRDQIAAQGSNPRISIAHWDVPIGIDACDKGGCAPIDFESRAEPESAAGLGPFQEAAGQPVVLTAGVVGVGILYNEEELKKHNIARPKSWTRSHAARI